MIDVGGAGPARAWVDGPGLFKVSVQARKQHSSPEASVSVSLSWFLP